MAEEMLYQEEVVKKPKKSKKKLLIILVSIVAVLGITAAILLNCFGQYAGEMYKSKADVYAYFAEDPHSSLCYDLSKYEAEIAELAATYDSENKAIADSWEQAQPLPEMYDTVVEKGNQMLIDFFAEEYGLSVEAEFENLRVTYADLPEGIGGVHFSPDESQWIETDGNQITLASYLLNDSYLEYDEVDRHSWEKEFYALYLHETIHFLGSNFTGADVLEWSDMIEGITESLTNAVLQYGGYSEDYASLYIHNTALADQLLIADKTIVVMLIDGTGYINPDELEAYIDANSFSGMGDAIEKATALAMAHPNTKKYQRMSQHLMGEYLKYYDLTEEQMIEIADNFIAPLSKFAD